MDVIANTDKNGTHKLTSANVTAIGTALNATLAATSKKALHGFQAQTLAIALITSPG